MFKLANNVVISAALASATELSEGLENLSKVSTELFLSPTADRLEHEMMTYSDTGNIDTNSVAPCSYATSSGFYNLIGSLHGDET